MSSQPYVFRSQPLLVPKIWGGRCLGEVFGKELFNEEPFGESWEVADLPEGQSLVGSGMLEGKTLGEVTRLWGRDLVGTRAASAEAFPLLIKLLDARRDLSVQVHPGAKQLGMLPPGARCKDECWLVLHSDAGEIIHGLSREGITAAELRAAAQEGELEGFLERVPVKPGDVVRVSPGTIHAICAGVALLEVQEPSDTTYRLYDYGRPGMDGRLRELHLEEALQVAHLGRSEEVILGVQELATSLELLVNAPGYRMERLSTGDGAVWTWEVDRGSVQVIYVEGGRVEVQGGSAASLDLGPYEAAVVPASMGSVTVRGRGEAALVISGLGSPDQLVKNLRSEKLGALVF